MIATVILKNGIKGLDLLLRYIMVFFTTYAKQFEF